MNLFNKRGSVFGLDARVALIIFTALTLVSGYTGLKAYTQIKAQGFVAELHAIAKGLNQMEVDLQRRIPTALNACMGSGCVYKTTYLALFDSSYIDSDYLSRWHGPYITPHAATHPEYGQAWIVDYSVSDSPCTAGEACYHWIAWPEARISPSTIENVNDMLDGSEGSPDTTGTFRWNDNGDGTYNVSHRLTRAISY